MMFLQREKINYLCQKYNLKVFRLGDTYKLFIQSSIFQANSYWYLFTDENLFGWDWILECDSKSIQMEHQYIKITDTQSLVVIDVKNCGKTKYKLSTGLKLNYNTQDELVAWIESFINNIRKLEKTLAVEDRVKNLEKDFERLMKMLRISTWIMISSDLGIFIEVLSSHVMYEKISLSGN